MKTHRIVLACLVPLAMSCGSPSAPTETPDLRGTWGGSAFAWRWSDSVGETTTVSRSSTCQGTIEIAQQDGGSFTGRYTIGCESGTGSSGELFDGRVTAEGRVTFRLRATQGWDPGLLPGWLNPPCPLVSDPGA